MFSGNWEGNIFLKWVVSKLTTLYQETEAQASYQLDKCFKYLIDEFQTLDKWWTNCYQPSSSTIYSFQNHANHNNLESLLKLSV